MADSLTQSQLAAGREPSPRRRTSPSTESKQQVSTRQRRGGVRRLAAQPLIVQGSIAAACVALARHVPFPLHRLRGGAYKDFVEREALRSADREGDDVGDVLAGIPISAVAVLFACLLAGSVM